MPFRLEFFLRETEYSSSDASKSTVFAVGSGRAFLRAGVEEVVANSFFAVPSLSDFTSASFADEQEDDFEAEDVSC